MTLSQKETTLLQDLKSQEKLCYDKYSRYSKDAHAEELKSLFGEIAAAEKSHYDTVCSILQAPVAGTTVTLVAPHTQVAVLSPALSQVGCLVTVAFS